MKRLIVAAVVVLLGAATGIAQTDHEGVDPNFRDPEYRGAAYGEGVPSLVMRAGVYMMFPDGEGARAAFGPASALITFNADSCADSTPLWLRDFGSPSESSGAPHGVWGLKGPQRIVANLYYSMESRAGVMDRFVRATLTADLEGDLVTGKGRIVFDSFWPEQIPAALDRDSDQLPAESSSTQVRLLRMR